MSNFEGDQSKDGMMFLKLSELWQFLWKPVNLLWSPKMVWWRRRFSVIYRWAVQLQTEQDTQWNVFVCFLQQKGAWVILHNFPIKNINESLSNTSNKNVDIYFKKTFFCYIDFLDEIAAGRKPKRLLAASFIWE